MKLFEAPELEVIKFAVTDVITTSVEEEDDGGLPVAGLGNCV